MSKKLLHLNYVTQSGRSFWFEVLEDPRYLAEWQEAGIPIESIGNTYPENLPAWFPTAWWRYLQNILNFKLPWSRS